MGKKIIVTSDRDWISNPNGRTARIKDSKGNTISKGTGSSSKEAIRSAKKKLYK